MWVIFITSAIVIAFITMVLIWIGNKLYLSIKRDNENFNSDIHIKKEDNTNFNSEIHIRKEKKNER